MEEVQDGEREEVWVDQSGYVSEEDEDLIQDYNDDLGDSEFR